ncbi:MAG: zinc ABC transporter solute-binding protein [Gammaproteobacteria bacterium]|jgi:zinc/manganese transport system substrate-binding protein|nr:zinc ABC transporter solute-binding protein [Gammaproteobacteria bacterium]
MHFKPTVVLLLLLGLPGITQAKLNVFACEPEWAALVKELSNGEINIYSATTSSQDPHHIQARPSLIAKARRADLLICTGADLEVAWLPLLLRKAGNANIQPGQPGYFMAADYVDMLEVPISLDRSLGDVHASGNPHIQLDPNNMLRVADALVQRLITLDKNNSASYQKKHAQFIKDWQQVIADWSARATSLRGQKIVMHHNSWPYLNHWLGFDAVATLEPIPGVPPSSSHLARLKTRLNHNDVAMIIHAAYINDRPALWLSAKTGIPVVSLPASVNFQQGESLQQFYETIINALMQAGE